MASKKSVDIKELVSLYESGISTYQIAKMYGYKTAKSISDKLKSAGIVLRTSKASLSLRKSYSDSMFSVLDESWKAYFLGLLLTDGWVTGTRTVGFSTVDFDLADYLSMKTSKSLQVIYPDKKPSSSLVCSGNSKTEYRLAFSSSTMVKDLERLGVVHQKTHTLQPPKLTKEESRFIPFILRGIIDGDGTLGFPTNSTNCMYFRIFSASEVFINWCISCLESLGMSNLRKRAVSGKYWEMNTARKDNIEILANRIYFGEMGMRRKAEAVHSFRSKLPPCQVIGK